MADSPYLCQCFKVTEEDLAKMARTAGTYDFDTLRAHYDIGSRCTSCEIDVRDELHELQRAPAITHAATGVPLMRRARTLARKLGTEARYRARVALRVPRRFGLFVVREENYESELVLSNLTFPDDDRNANGDRVRFDTRLYDAGGTLLGRRRGITLDANTSAIYRLNDLTDAVPRRFAGNLILDFHGLRETGALRPYCRLKYGIEGESYVGSCHYHDQYIQRRQYQHVVNTHPLEPDQTCWIALANPIGEPYETRAMLRSGGETFSTTISLSPFGALWASVPSLFQDAPTGDRRGANAQFWLEGDGAIMSWNFWHLEAANVWIAQHK